MKFQFVLILVSGSDARPNLRDVNACWLALFAAHTVADSTDTGHVVVWLLVLTCGFTVSDNRGGIHMWCLRPSAALNPALRLQSK